MCGCVPRRAVRALDPLVARRGARGAAGRLSRPRCPRCSLSRSLFMLFWNCGAGRWRMVYGMLPNGVDGFVIVARCQRVDLERGADVPGPERLVETDGCGGCPVCDCQPRAGPLYSVSVRRSNCPPWRRARPRAEQSTTGGPPPAAGRRRPGDEDRADDGAVVAARAAATEQRPEPPATRWRGGRRPSSSRRSWCCRRVPRGMRGRGRRGVGPARGGESSGVSSEPVMIVARPRRRCEYMRRGAALGAVPRRSSASASALGPATRGTAEPGQECSVGRA